MRKKLIVELMAALWRVLSGCSGVMGAALLYLIAAGFPLLRDAGMVALSHSEHSPGDFVLPPALLAEFFLSFMLMVVIISSTVVITSSTRRHDKSRSRSLTVGWAFTRVHLMGIVVTATAVYLISSVGPALFAGNWALAQLWAFLVVPSIGALSAGLLHHCLFQHSPAVTELELSDVACSPPARHLQLGDAGAG